MAPALPLTIPTQPTTTEAFPSWIIPVSVISGLVIVIPIVLVLGVMAGLTIRDRIHDRRRRHHRERRHREQRLDTASRRHSAESELPAGASEVILPEAILRSLQRARAHEGWVRDEQQRAREAWARAEQQRGRENAVRAEAQRIYGDVLGPRPRPLVDMITYDGRAFAEVAGRPSEPLPLYRREWWVKEPLPAYCP